jgi:hypothetical protein
MKYLHQAMKIFSNKRNNNFKEATAMIEYREKEIYGDFYENGSKPLAVVINGSRAGIPPIGEKLMNYLTSNFNVLFLAYFGVGELPETLEMVPIEYFVNAINTVKEKLGLKDNQVIVIGNSKGGEAALLTANYLQSALTISCVSPCYVFQGLGRTPSDTINSPKSSWSLNNKELPYIKFYYDEAVMKDIANNIFRASYEKGIEHNFNKAAIINVDKYKGKMLLISSGCDTYWPSKEMSAILAENSKSDIKHISLDLEGHYYLKYEESTNEIINFLESNAPA